PKRSRGRKRGRGQPRRGRVLALSVTAASTAVPAARAPVPGAPEAGPVSGRRSGARRHGIGRDGVLGDAGRGLRRGLNLLQVYVGQAGQRDRGTPLAGLDERERVAVEGVLVESRAGHVVDGDLILAGERERGPRDGVPLVADELAGRGELEAEVERRVRDLAVDLRDGPVAEQVRVGGGGRFRSGGR